ncbi:MAG: hypothetical protein GXP48_11005 [Acidobacteria bacterium]|nr:hypothetical protein [Acidobacteriota bacterium]
MVTFLTLFIGVVSGLQTVQVAVTHPVVRVELRLNGKQVATLHAPLWRTTLDLGDGLMPSVLEAVAYDRRGAETGRDRQLLNLPQQEAAARIVPEADASGRVRAAILLWEAPAFPRPIHVSVTLDGRPLPFPPSHVIQLSGMTGSAAHVLSAEITFSATVTIRKTLTFGEGGTLRATSSQLTAVPISLVGRPVPVSLMRGFFVAHGKPLTVDSVENGPSRVIFVKDVGVAKRISKVLSRHRHVGKLGRSDFVQIEEAVPHMRSTSLRMVAVFPVTAPVRITRRSRLAWLLLRHPSGKPGVSGRHLADAVAVAGMTAVRSEHRRVVVLCLAGAKTDRSVNSVAAVRTYLKALRVPLEVWDFRKGAGTGLVDGSPWGALVPIGSKRQFVHAVKRLKKMLARQRIVWVEGECLPQEITLGPAAHGIRLVE